MELSSELKGIAIQEGIDITDRITVMKWLKEKAGKEKEEKEKARKNFYKIIDEAEDIEIPKEAKEYAEKNIKSLMEDSEKDRWKETLQIVRLLSSQIRTLQIRCAILEERPERLAILEEDQSKKEN